MTEDLDNKIIEVDFVAEAKKLESSQGIAKNIIHAKFTQEAGKILDSSGLYEKKGIKRSGILGGNRGGFLNR